MLNGINEVFQKAHYIYDIEGYDKTKSRERIKLQ